MSYKQRKLAQRLSNKPIHDFKLVMGLKSLCDNHNALTILSKLIQWHMIVKGKPFYKTTLELTLETDLTRNKVDKAKTLLIDKGLLKVYRKGFKGKTHFVLNMALISPYIQSVYKPVNNLANIGDNTTKSSQLLIPGEKHNTQGNTHDHEKNKKDNNHDSTKAPLTSRLCYRSVGQVLSQAAQSLKQQPRKKNKPMDSLKLAILQAYPNQKNITRAYKLLDSLEISHQTLLERLQEQLKARQSYDVPTQAKLHLPELSEYLTLKAWNTTLGVIPIGDKLGQSGKTIVKSDVLPQLQAPKTVISIPSPQRHGAATEVIKQTNNVVVLPSLTTPLREAQRAFIEAQQTGIGVQEAKERLYDALQRQQ